jgi:hypothetical protein
VSGALFVSLVEGFLDGLVELVPRMSAGAIPVGRGLDA